MRDYCHWSSQQERIQLFSYLGETYLSPASAEPNYEAIILESVLDPNMPFNIIEKKYFYLIDFNNWVNECKGLLEEFSYAKEYQLKKKNQPRERSEKISSENLHI